MKKVHLILTLFFLLEFSLIGCSNSEEVYYEIPKSEVVDVSSMNKETKTPKENKGADKSEKEEPSQTPSADSATLEKKEEFLNKANEIEQYADKYSSDELAVVYEKWDNLLNDVYQYLKGILPNDEFEELKKDELAWINEKENAIAGAGGEFAGGTDVAIQYTQERCYYLISLIN